MQAILKKLNLEKVLEYSWCLFIFILPWQTRLFLRAGEINGGYSEYLTISLYASDIILLFVLSLQIFKVLREDRLMTGKTNISQTWYLLALLELVIFISIFVASDKWLAIYHYILFLLGIGIFWLLQSGRLMTKNFYYSFFAAALIQSLLAIWQFIFQKTFAWKWLGLSAHTPEILGTAVVETAGIRYLRAYGAFDHPNILGAYLVFALFLFLIWQIKARINPENFSLKKKIIFHASYIIIFTGIFFSFSRAAWLAFVIGLICLWSIVYLERNEVGKKILCRNSLLTIILAIVLIGNFYNLVTTRVSNNTRLEQKSINERISSYQEAKELINKKPISGVGIGNYVLALRDEISPGAAVWSLQPVHNALLLIFVELGIFGVLLVLFIILNFLWSILKERVNIYFLPILISFIIFSLVDHWLISFHFGILFLWLGLGMVEAREG